MSYCKDTAEDIFKEFEKRFKVYKQKTVKRGKVYYHYVYRLPKILFDEFKNTWVEENDK